jgi:hypothetical protein
MGKIKKGGKLMKASILTGEVNLAVKEKLDLGSLWKKLFKDLEAFFGGSFESDWEKKTGLDWQEWGSIPTFNNGPRR